jgi:UDP:flavonoid glycosyltransferase YjiC (YdhE family)
MRIVFSSRPAFGHVFAIAPLAAAARAAGHEVIFASGESFLPRLESWGFETRKVGEAIDWGFRRAATRFPELLQPERPEFGARMFVDILGPRSFEDMTAVIEEAGPDLVVYEATDVGAGVAAAAAGVPAACHSLSVWVTDFMDAIGSRLRSFWAEVGSEPSVDITVGDVFLDIWPPSMQSDEVSQATDERWLLRPLTWGDESADVPAWIEEVDGPLVFVSLGTIFWGKELLTKVVEGLADVDCDALVLAGVDATPDDFDVKSDRLRVTGFVNQKEILRHADVVVHHGGAGTMLGSLAQGLPALVLGQGADRPHTAASLEASGAGIRLEPDEATPQDIAGAVTQLINEDRYRVRAGAIKSEMEAMPLPEEIVDRLETFVTRRRKGS